DRGWRLADRSGTRGLMLKSVLAAIRAGSRPSTMVSRVPRLERARSQRERGHLRDPIATASGGAIVLLLLAGLGLRLLYLAMPTLDSDQAIFGLMAAHILRGELPIFQWGYHYMGTIESFVAAPLMLVFGETRFALNLSPALFSMLFAA